MSQSEFIEFYDSSKDRCLRAVVGLGLGREQGEEALAEAYTRAWSRWAQVRSLAAPEAWVVRTAVNADISWWRKRRREWCTPDLPDSEEHNALPDLDLLAALRRLPPGQRKVVVLRYLLDLSTDQTAREIGITPGTVASQLHHALSALREHLNESEGTLR